MPFHKVSSIWYLVSGIKYTKYKILNTKYCKTKGFTLIELLVVLGILAAAVGASMIFLTSVLKGTNQANVTAEVKQNGQVVLDSLEKQIRGATDVECANSAGNSVDCSDASASLKYLKLVRSDEDPLHIGCFLDSLPKKHPICNGSSSDLTSFKYLREADASEQSTEFPALLAHSTSVAPRICFSSESKTTWPFCLTSAVTLA